MPRYATETTVSVEKSRAEIEETLRRYGASAFHSGWEPDKAVVGFRIKGLLIRFILPFPGKSERRFTHKKIRGHEQKMSELQSARAYEQELRSRWRALLLVIKAKLEAVECGISTHEQEFLAHIVMPNDLTVGDWLVFEAIPSIVAGRMPTLALPAPKKDDVIDAEVIEKTSG